MNNFCYPVDTDENIGLFNLADNLDVSEEIYYNFNFIGMMDTFIVLVLFCILSILQT